LTGTGRDQQQCYRTALRWLVFSNLYVALCGAALTAATHVLLGLPPRIDHLAGLVFCCTLVIYNLDRLVEPSPGDSEHERWIAAHRRPLWALAALGALGVAGFATQLRPAALASLIPAGLIALGYCVPVVRWAGRWYRLKALPGAKLLLIGGVWTYATAGLAMIEAGTPIDPQMGAVLLARLLFLAGVALPFDLPDTQRDRRAGIVTLPTLLGVGATRGVAALLLALACGLTAFHPRPAAWAVLGSCLAGLALIAALRPGRSVWYFMVLLDGTLLLQAGALWLAAG